MRIVVEDGVGSVNKIWSRRSYSFRYWKGQQRILLPFVFLNISFFQSLLLHRVKEEKCCFSLSDCKSYSRKCPAVSQ